MKQPLDNVQWIDFFELKANDYNPNFVFNAELKLLEVSLLKHGWVQPILIDESKEIIDGFHRWSLVRMSDKLKNMTQGKVPCCVMALSLAERKMLTIRINRAKGHHVAVKMSEIIKDLINTYGCSISQVCEGIGATKDEIDLLLMENVFEKFDIKNHKYSKAWQPKVGD